MSWENSSFFESFSDQSRLYTSQLVLKILTELNLSPGEDTAIRIKEIVEYGFEELKEFVRKELDTYHQQTSNTTLFSSANHENNSVTYFPCTTYMKKKAFIFSKNKKTSAKNICCTCILFFFWFFLDSSCDFQSILCN